MACEKEKAALAKELELCQKNHNDLIDNIKQVLASYTTNGKKRKQLSVCEDKLQLIESIVRGGARSSNGQRANWRE